MNLCSIFCNQKFVHVAITQVKQFFEEKINIRYQWCRLNMHSSFLSSDWLCLGLNLLWLVYSILEAEKYVEFSSPWNGVLKKLQISHLSWLVNDWFSHPVWLVDNSWCRGGEFLHVRQWEGLKVGFHVLKHNTEPVFVNVQGAQESIPRNRICQPM